MTQQIRLWEITGTDDQTLAEIKGSQIPLEENLEGWLKSDISMLDSNLLVIGRQVLTDFGGIIDLLCIDNSGDLVVVELKKGKTPREVTAQALDYASWVKDLSSQRITEIADEYLGDRGTLDDVFQDEFDQELPETLNSSHRSLIVAESLDPSTERIINYLAELDVPINVLTVQHFQDSEGKGILAQVYLIEPEEAVAKSRSQSKRTSYSVEHLHNIAKENGIGELYGKLRTGVQGILTASAYNPAYVAYNARRKEGGIRTVMTISTTPHTAKGGLAFTMHATRFETILGMELDTLKQCLPKDIQETDITWRNLSEDEKQDLLGLKGAFQEEEEVDKFINRLKNSDWRI